MPHFQLQQPLHFLFFSFVSGMFLLNNVLHVTVLALPLVSKYLEEKDINSKQSKNKCFNISNPNFLIAERERDL